MKLSRPCKLVVLVAVALAAGCASAPAADPASDAAVQAEFRALIDDYYRSWTVADGAGDRTASNAAHLYAKEAGRVFYDIAPMKYESWASYRHGVSELIDQVASSTFTPHDDLVVTRRGSVAWTTVTFTLAERLKTGASLELVGRHTAIWEQRDGRWQIVHEHLSVPLAL